MFAGPSVGRVPVVPSGFLDHIAAALAVNVLINTRFNAISAAFRSLAAAVWVALRMRAALRVPKRSVLPGAAKGSVFVISLLLCASMTPVDLLPRASWQTAPDPGFIAAVAYVIGFFVVLTIIGFRPGSTPRGNAAPAR